MQRKYLLNIQQILGVFYKHYILGGINCINLKKGKIFQNIFINSISLFATELLQLKKKSIINQFDRFGGNFFLFIFALITS